MSGAADRRARCADLIAGGRTVYEAMIAAGFGRAFAAGNADTFAGWLTAKGYLKPAAASRAKSGKPAPVRDSEPELDGSGAPEKE